MTSLELIVGVYLDYRDSFVYTGYNNISNEIYYVARIALRGKTSSLLGKSLCTVLIVALINVRPIRVGKYTYL